MRDDVTDEVCIPHNVEVKTPVLVDAACQWLDVSSYFLACNEGVLQILLKESGLFEEALAHMSRGIFQSFESTGKVVNLHRERLALFAAALFLSCAFM